VSGEFGISITRGDFGKSKTTHGFPAGACAWGFSRFRNAVEKQGVRGCVLPMLRKVGFLQKRKILPNDVLHW